MDKLFDKLPYDDLDGIKFIHLLAGAAGIGLALFIAYYFTLYSATNTEFKMLAKQKVEAERTLKRYKGIVAKKDRVEKNLALVKGKFDSFKNQMPSQAEIPNLIQRISVFGRDRKMKMVALTVEEGDRKSTRLNSSHVVISYAVFCLKKKKNKKKKKENKHKIRANAQ